MPTSTAAATGAEQSITVPEQLAIDGNTPSDVSLPLLTNLAHCRFTSAVSHHDFTGHMFGRATQNNAAAAAC